VELAKPTDGFPLIRALTLDKLARRGLGGAAVVIAVLLVGCGFVMLLAGASYAQGAPAAKGLSLSPSAIQINPKRPNIVYASTVGDDTHEGGVIKSTDAGKTWSLADTGLTNPTSPTDSEDLRVDPLALDPRSTNVLYAGTGLGVFKTTDGAKTWKLASTGIDFSGDGLIHRMLEGFITVIAIDPVHTSTVYAADHRAVWKTTNGGASWKRVLRYWASSLGIDPRRPKTVYAGVWSGAIGSPRAAICVEIVKTVDGGGTWRATGRPRPQCHNNYFGSPIVVDRRSSSAEDDLRGWIERSFREREPGSHVE